MSKQGKSKHTAGGQYAGYRWQVCQALIMALRAHPASTENISVERHDDISIWNVEQGVVCSVQAKHSLGESTFGDRSVVLWKTLQAWIEGASAEQRILSTTLVLRDNSKLYAYLFGRDQNTRQELIEELDTIALDQRNDALKPAYEAWSGLTPRQKQSLVETIQVDYEKSRLKHFLVELEGVLTGLRTSPQYVGQIARKLSQWWDEQVDGRMTSAGATVSIGEVHEARVHFLEGIATRYVYNPKPISPNKLAAMIAGGDMTLLKQMALVGLSDEDEQRQALQHYFEAGENREEWKKQKTDAKDDLRVHDQALLQAADTARRKIDLNHASDPDHARGARFFFEAMSLNSILGGEQRQGPLPNGTLHYYSNRKNIGWHPDYENRI